MHNVKVQEIACWDIQQRNTLSFCLCHWAHSPNICFHDTTKQSAATSDTHMRPMLCCWPHVALWLCTSHTVACMNYNMILIAGGKEGHPEHAGGWNSLLLSLWVFLRDVMSVCVCFCVYLGPIERHHDNRKWSENVSSITLIGIRKSFSLIFIKEIKPHTENKFFIFRTSSYFIIKPGTVSNLDYFELQSWPI